MKFIIIFILLLALAILIHGIPKQSIMRAAAIKPLSSEFILALINSALKSGCSIISTIQMLGDYLPKPQAELFAKVHAQLIETASWQTAWQSQNEFGDIKNILETPFTKGTPIGDSIEKLLESNQADFIADLQIKGERVGTKTLIPLGLLFLPSFIVLSLIPLVMSLAFGG